MGLETGTYISDLNASNPVGSTDKVQTADDHIRLLKSTIKASFPGVTGAVTATHTELNVLDGITATTAELNILDGVTATASELNALDGITATVTELNYTDGVTSAIQTQLDAKAATSHNHAGTDITSGTVADARLSSNVPLKNAANVFTATQRISATAAKLIMYDNDGGTHEKATAIQAADVAGKAFRILSMLDDATTDDEELLVATRSGGAWTSLALTADDITVNGVNVTDFARLSQSPSFTGSVTAGTGLTVTTGGLTVSAGGAAITGNSSVTGTMTVSSTLGVTGALTAATIANSTSTTLVAGQLHFIDGNATLPNLAAGEWIQIVNDSGSSITISKNGSDTTYWSLTGATVSTSFTLAARGKLTAVCNPAGSAVYVSGNISGAT